MVRERERGINQSFNVKCCFCSIQKSKRESYEPINIKAVIARLGVALKTAHEVDAKKKNCRLSSDTVLIILCWWKKQNVLSLETGTITIIIIFIHIIFKVYDLLEKKQATLSTSSYRMQVAEVRRRHQREVVRFHNIINQQYKRPTHVENMAIEPFKNTLLFHVCLLFWNIYV